MNTYVYRSRLRSSFHSDSSSCRRFPGLSFSFEIQTTPRLFAWRHQGSHGVKTMRLSFRAPAGFVFGAGQRIYRCVYPQAAEELRAFLDSEFAWARMAEGSLAGTSVLPSVPAEIAPGDIPEGSLILSHRRIAFPNYPYEWATEMLESAAVLTLRLAREASAAGYSLKDGTPFNVMFEGVRPVFLDVLSF